MQPTIRQESASKSAIHSLRASRLVATRGGRALPGGEAPRLPLDGRQIFLGQFGQGESKTAPILALAARPQRRKPNPYRWTAAVIKLLMQLS